MVWSSFQSAIFLLLEWFLSPPNKNNNTQLLYTFIMFSFPFTIVVSHPDVFGSCTRTASKDSSVSTCLLLKKIIKSGQKNQMVV